MPEKPITHRRKIEFSALDISAHPHPAGIYPKLFDRARRLKKAFKIVGHEFGELSELSKHKDPKSDEVVAISGVVYRYLKIDENADWFDVETGEEATDDAKSGLSIPSNLRPNLRRIYWVFDVPNHVLIFATHNGDASLSPIQAEGFFSRLMDQAAAGLEEVEYTEVTKVKSKEAIQQIFKNHRVSRLEIELSRPNADDSESALGKILKQMEAEGARKSNEVLTGDDDNGLKESPRIKEKLLASQRIGRAQAVVFGSDGEKDTIDTNEHPLIEAIVYEPKDHRSFKDFLLDAADQLLLQIVLAIKKSKK